MDLVQFENENVSHVSEKSKIATLNDNFLYDFMLDFAIIFCYFYDYVAKFKSRLCSKSFMVCSP